MGLIHDIQAAAISETADVPTLLRKCKLLAARLGNDAFAQWVEHELTGYPEGTELPSYRVIPTDNFGTFQGPWGSGYSKLQIPVSVLPTEELQEHYRAARLRDGAAAYAHLLEGERTATAKLNWPIALAVHHASEVAPSFQCVAAWQEVPIGAFVRLFDLIKTRILSFAIELEREAPAAGESPIGAAPTVSQETVTNIFNTTINGPVGNLSNAGTNTTQNATVAVGDWEAFRSQAQHVGLAEQDLRQLQPTLQQLAADPAQAREVVADTAPDSLIGRLARRAAAAASGVSVEVASAALARAIAIYCGIPSP
jgi:hypothetical protein